MLDPSTTAAGVRNSLTGLISSFRSTTYDEEDQPRSLRGSQKVGSCAPGATDSSYSDSVEDVRAIATATTASSGSRYSAQEQTSQQSNAAVAIDSLLKTVFGSCTGVQQSLDETRQRGYGNDDVRRSSSGSMGRPPSNPRNRSRGRGKPSGSPGNVSNTQVRSSGAEHDECYYARFYADDHAQAAQAVLQLREREEADRAALLASLDDPKVRSMLKLKELGMQHQQPNEPNATRQINPAPVSELVPIDTSNKPSKNDDEAGRLGAIALLAPAASSDEPDENTYIDFDDGISALSAHTLEEMVRRDAMMEEAEKVAAESGDKFQTAVAAGWRRHKARQASEAGTSEILRADASPRGVKDFRETPRLDNRKVAEGAKTRGVHGNNGSDLRNLNNTLELNRGMSGISHASRPSIGAASSGTTNFESVWKKEEAKYWQDVADGEVGDGDGDEVRSNRRKTKSVNEQRSSPPSSLSSFTSSSYHPHDTIAPIIASTVNSPETPVYKSKSKTRRTKLSGSRSRREIRGYRNVDVDSNGFPTTESFDECNEI